MIIVKELRFILFVILPHAPVIAKHHGLGPIFGIRNATFGLITIAAMALVIINYNLKTFA